jgi:lipopolysaccharide export LptBFGC system permease protein LptF
MCLSRELLHNLLMATQNYGTFTIRPGQDADEDDADGDDDDDVDEKEASHKIAESGDWLMKNVITARYSLVQKSRTVVYKNSRAHSLARTQMSRMRREARYPYTYPLRNRAAAQTNSAIEIGEVFLMLICLLRIRLRILLHFPLSCLFLVLFLFPFIFHRARGKR